MEELLRGLEEALGESRFKLVKGKRRMESLPDVVVTAFHHFGAVALAAAKLCTVLEDLGILPEGSWEECFWAGAVHDYEKVLEADVLERISEISSIPRERLDLLASCTEAGYAVDRRTRVTCYVLMLSDYWASQRSLTSYLPSDKRYLTALKALERQGLRIIPVYSGMPRAIMAASSEDLVKLFSDKGWLVLFSYADGLLLVGDKSSEDVSREEIAEILLKVMKTSLEGGEAQKQTMEKSLSPFKKLATRVEELEGLSKEELRKEFHSITTGKGEKKDIVPILAIAYEKGYEDLVNEIREYVLKNKKKLQVRALIGNPYYFENVIKQGLVEQFLEEVRNSESPVKESLLAMALTFYSKNKIYKNVEKLLDSRLKELQTKKYYTPLVFAEVLGILLKRPELLEKSIEELGKESKEDTGLRAFAKYLACNAFSSPILKGKCDLPKEVGRCYICGAPIYSKTFTFSSYFTYAFGSKGGVEIYTPRQKPFVSIDSGQRYAKERYICPACAFEGTLLNYKLSSPFAAFAVHPSTSVDLMKYMIKKMKPVVRSTLFDLCRGRVEEEGKGEEPLIDYAHALALLKIEGLKKDEKGFGAHGAAIAKFLAIAGFALERSSGGQMALTWEIPLNMSSEPVSAPQLPTWLVPIIDFSLREGDSLAPLVHVLKAWAYKACMTKDSNELRETFLAPAPHTLLFLLTPPKSLREEMYKDRTNKTFFKFWKHYSYILKEVSEVEKLLRDEDRLLPKLWSYAYALAPAFKDKNVSKHKVQDPLRTALYRFADYLEMGLNVEDAIELASSAAQEDAERSLGNVEIKESVKGILKFVYNYINSMNPSKRRQFFEDILDTVYIFTKKVVLGGEKK
ncbi:hypothetical protein IPA_06400 [Ignicoccus pacificus DSM 13166]|uniref:Uncharacterized protein n=1 Tax=Ignicoccus pacificus DSM 13166 TaxID=940294 RepID=A0A977PL24_9CREN|nr:hypothetical protein IPA_06400 [Ignicoccus pacificus DSM 13166]